MTLVYITCKDVKEAQKISMHLLKKRLIACANIFPINSIFWWKGKITKSKEHVIIAKTSKKNLKELEAEVKKTHSYAVQCILSIDSKSNKEFANWLNKEIK